MNLFGLMDVSASALKAERVRAEVVAANMANAETTQTAEGGPYRRHHVVFGSEGENSFQQSMLAQSGVPVGIPFLTGTSNLDNKAVPGGVSIAAVVQDVGEPLRRYDPQHPDAGPDGYVSYPNIDPLTEMVDLIGATRAYGLNVSAVQAEKSMLTSSLELLKS